MPNYERGSVEPDDVRVFDGGHDDEDEGGSHLPVVIVISLLVLAAFGGVVWLAYNNGVARGRAEVPSATAAQNAAGEQQAVAPGSGAIPAKQIKVYQQPASADENVEPVIATPAPTRMAATAPPAQLVKPPPALRSQPMDTKPAPTVQAPPAHAVSVAAQKSSAVAQTALAPPAAAIAAPPRIATGAFVLQIGAYKSQSDADDAWKTYQAKHAALLSGFGESVQKADLGDKGTWYRLRVGSFTDKSAAAGLCDRLKAEGGACFLAK